MAISLDSISKTSSVRPPRIILLGGEKIGKSTFGSEAPDPIFIPVKGEEGIDALEVPHFPPVGSHADMLETIGCLYSQDHDYKTVVIDSASTLEPIIYAEAMRIEGVDSESKLGGGYGRTYDTPLRLWRDIMDGLDALRNDKGMTVILIGHVTRANFEDPINGNYTQFAFDVNKKGREALARWSDVILFANWQTIVKKEDGGFGKATKTGVGTGQRKLFTQARPAHPGGGRGVFGQLPYELPLDYGAFSQAIQNQINNK